MNSLSTTHQKLITAILIPLLLLPIKDNASFSFPSSFSFIKNTKTAARLDAIKGKCTFGDCENGYGCLLLASGDKYIGEFQAGERDGQGVYFYKNGNKYVGSWEKDKKQGEGRFYKKSGSVKRGNWSNDKWVASGTYGCLLGDCDNIYSVYLTADGRKYMGLFKDGKPFTHGLVYDENGGKYIGSWNNEQRNGIGIYIHPDGRIEQGLWSADKFIRERTFAH